MGRRGLSALLITSAADRSALDAVIESNPFWIEESIAEMTVTEWGPMFGAFNAESSMPIA